MYGNNKIFLAIIIGAVIIGGCVYFGLSNYSNIPWNNGIAAQTSSVKNSATSDVALTTTCGAEDNTIVTKVIDGDTVVVEGGYHVRLLGMDADETGYPCYLPAKTYLESLVLGKQVKLEKDKTDLDQYGRCLRYIFTGSTNVDAQLVKEGLAIARFYEPDIKYKAEITTAEKYAESTVTGCKWNTLLQNR